MKDAEHLAAIEAALKAVYGRVTVSPRWGTKALGAEAPKVYTQPTK